MKNTKLKITFKDTDNTREVLVPSNFDFEQLSEVVCILYAWEDEYICDYMLDEKTVIAPGDAEDANLLGYITYLDNCVNVGHMFSQYNLIKYTYSLGEEILFDIVLEESDIEGEAYPVMTAFGGTMLRQHLVGEYGKEKLERFWGEAVNADEINRKLKETFSK